MYFTFKIEYYINGREKNKFFKKQKRLEYPRKVFRSQVVQICLVSSVVNKTS